MHVTLQRLAAALILAAATPVWAGTALYTSDQDADQVSDPNVSYSGETITLVGGPTAAPPPRGSLVETTLPGGLNSLPAGDVSFEMTYIPGQTPTIGDPSSPSGVNGGIQMRFDGGAALSIAWGASFGNFYVAAVFFPGSPGVVAQSAIVNADVRAIRLVRVGNTVTPEYDTASGTVALNAVNLTAVGTPAQDVSALNVTYNIVSSNTFGSLSYSYLIDAITVCGEGIPTVNGGVGPCAVSEGEGEGDGEGEGEGETPCATTLSEGCPPFGGEGQGYYTLLDGFIPFPVSWNASDLTQNGLIDSWEVALLERVLCTGVGPHYADALCAYEANLTTYRDEPTYGPPFAGFEHVIVALQTMSSESQAAQGSLGLQGDYRVAGTGAKAPGEPFSADGDLDNDGHSNLVEYTNTLNASLSQDDFIEAALNPLLNGSQPASSLPVGGSLGLIMGVAGLAAGAARVLRQRR